MIQSDLNNPAKNIDSVNELLTKQDREGLDNAANLHQQI